MVISASMSCFLVPANEGGIDGLKLLLMLAQIFAVIQFGEVIQKILLFILLCEFYSLSL